MAEASGSRRMSEALPRGKGSQASQRNLKETAEIRPSRTDKVTRTGRGSHLTIGPIHSSKGRIAQTLRPCGKLRSRGTASESNTGTPALPAVSQRRGPVRRFAHGSADPGDLDTVQAQRAGQRDGHAGAAKDSDVDRAWVTTPHGELGNSPR